MRITTSRKEITDITKAWLAITIAFVIVFSKSKQGLHDRLVKTEVVKVRPATPLGKQVLIALGIVVYYVVVRMLFV